MPPQTNRMESESYIKLIQYFLKVLLCYNKADIYKYANYHQAAHQKVKSNYFLLVDEFMVINC